MAGKKISRNDPCPCGSGKKFKHCCIGKDIDWTARAQRSPLRSLGSPRPRPVKFSPLSFSFFETSDRRLKELAGADPGRWPPHVEQLWDKTSPDERMKVYAAIRAAGVLPDEATLFLMDHAIQILTFPDVPYPEADEEDEALDSNSDPLAEAIPIVLRRYGAEDWAELFVTETLDYERRRERGRQFFHGPPDEDFAPILRKRGVID
jgi:hypothetical protein